MPSRLPEAFAARFGRAPGAIARVPGRVNLIGEHTDYNDGFVLPLAIELDTQVAAAARTDGRVHVWSETLGTGASWPMGRWDRGAQPHWTSYVSGVVALLAARGAAPPGADLLIDSTVPAGGGLSSSAALELAVAAATASVADARFEPRGLADLCREAEHRFAGVPCGLMDQYVCALARAGCALWLDCRTGSSEHIPLRLGEHLLVVIDSGIRHELAAGHYADRRTACASAVAALRRCDPGIAALRDVDLQRHGPALASLREELRRRVRHVVSENARVQAAVAALRSGDLVALGRIMSAGHVSLRDDYQASIPEIDELVAQLAGIPGVLGARLTGGGFGGCVIALARAGALPAVRAALAAGRATPLWHCVTQAVAGLRVERL